MYTKLIQEEARNLLEGLTPSSSSDVIAVKLIGTLNLLIRLAEVAERFVDKRA